MPTKESMLAPYVKMSNSSSYWVYAEDAKISMDKWAKHQAISFMNWTLEIGCTYTCTDENQWTNINDPYDSITTEQLHEKFIEQQTENK
jgi:hypothetical protein